MSAMMELWQNVLSTALVGTERQALDLSLIDNTLKPLLDQLDQADRERTLLSAAGVIALWRNAGYQPASDSQPLSLSSEPDVTPRCRALANQHLALMLQGQHENVLPEWLSALAGADQRVGEEYLPALLELGRTQPSLRLLILPVLGRRGCWLAQQNAAWRYVATESHKMVWQTGSQDERLFLLQQLRQENPDRARELLASTWSEETAKARAGYLAALVVGLSMADEPFLENLLDDRSREVRRTAADLLARLAESRLVQRLTEQTRSLLTFEPGKLLRKDRLNVTLPETCAEMMRRDGIEPKPPAGLEQVGEKAWQLQQLIGIVPPSYWSQIWRKSAVEIIRASHKHEWQSVLLAGWSLAAQRHRDEEWVEALLSAGSKSDESLAGLLDTLSPERREAYVLELFHSERDPLQDDSLALAALHYCQYPWSVALSRLVLDEVRRHIAATKVTEWRAYWQLQSSFASFAHYFPPLLADEANANWPTQAASWSQWARTVDEFLSILHFRREALNTIKYEELS
jgi:hypothetical protein